ncbi:heterokaryon incompatibility protein Het-C-domain-containing protein [Mycena capillaripes]|nr:heterokaryon incompatibility protein Het-C-domain-containing protein [Mycena capillaripes]
MTGSPNFTTTLLLLTLVLVLLPETVHAFGAGDIPDFAFLNDKAFRHGDIENILSTLAKAAGHAAASHGGGNLFGFAKSLIQSATSGPGGPKFSSGDIKKVYFGNWLRDYSQAMDIGGLSKLTAESLVLVVSVLGFMTFGFATEEFQVTPERLGVYLPVEHIDNPRGYAEKEGDARRFHPKLRPPVNPRELDIDPRNGMKNYMASENQGWDTSTAHIRRVLTACIEMGRRAQGRDGPELYEAYRLLGTGLHTLEDLLAHSNWVEIALRKMGYSEVFCHVGEDTEIETPSGRAPPLVTGTFGGADFLHSLMGEAGDKLSQASVTDLATKMNQAQEGDNSNVSTLKSILSKLPIGGGDSDSKMSEGEQLHEEAKAYNFDPNNIAPPDVQQKLLQLLKWRDGLMRSILEKIEMIPGLDSLIDQLSNALNAYVYTVIAPWITPVLQQATSVLGEGSKAVINSEDQYEVFDNPRASDPTHSLLSKDHFGLILNEPAGKIAMIVVQHSVKIIVQAWSDNSDPSRAIDVILEAFHHPYYATGRSAIQRDMFQEVERWLGGLDEDEARQTLEALTKESVRNGKNKRLGSENEDLSEPGYGGCGHGHGVQPQRRPQEQEQSYGSGGGQSGEGAQSSYSSGYGRQSEGYGSSRNDNDNDGYARGSERTEGYGQTEEYSREGDDGYGRRESRHHHEDNEDSYGSRTQQTESSDYAPSYAQPEERYSGSSGSGRTEEYGGGGGNEYESREESQSYGRGSGRSGYGRSEAQTYGGSGERTQTQYASSESRYETGRNEEQEQPEYGGGNEYGGEARRGSSGYGRSEAEAYDRDASGAYESESAGRGRGSSSSGYGRSEDSEPRYGAYGQEESESGRGASGYGSGYAITEPEERGYGSGREERNVGYASREEERGVEESESYGGEREYNEEPVGGYSEDRDETFGAERLNINEEESEQGYGYGRSRNEYESSY